MFGALIPPNASSAATFSPRSRSMCSAATCIPHPLSTEAHRRSTSLYEVLKVKHTATIKEIKAAYRSLSKVYHPDSVRLEDAEKGIRCGREFMEIHDAYATLSDPTARKVYDLTLGFGGHGRRPTRRWETDQCWWKKKWEVERSFPFFFFSYRDMTQVRCT